MVPATEITALSLKKLYLNWIKGDNGFRSELGTNNKFKFNPGQGDDFFKIYDEQILGQDSPISLGPGNDWIGLDWIGLDWNGGQHV